MGNDITKEYLRQKFGELRDVIRCLTTETALETRPVCVVNGEGCLRAYAVVSTTATGTTILRVEGADGVVIEDYVLTNCTCDCTDVQA